MTTKQIIYSAVSAGFIAACTFGGTYLKYREGIQSGNLGYLTLLEQSNRELIRSKQEVMKENMRLLKNQQYAELSPTRLIKAMMYADPLPSWIKRISFDGSTPNIQMIYVNPAFERRFGVTAAKYKNRRDLEVGWPTKMSRLFELEDMQVFEGKDATCRQVNIHGRLVHGTFVLGEPIKEWSCKWVVPLVGGDWAVAGRIIPETATLETLTHPGPLKKLGDSSTIESLPW